MRISSAIGGVDFGDVSNEESGKKTSMVAMKNMHLAPSVTRIDTAAQTPESAVAGNGKIGIFELAKTVFSALSKLLGGIVAFFKGLLSPNSDNAPPVNPAPFTPSRPGDVLPSDVPPYSPSTTLGKKPDDIFGGFRQGPDGNCITVSAIKASMMKFGQKPTDIFTEVTKLPDGYKVTMRDGVKVELSDSELKMASREAKFKGYDKEMISDANFMYAVSAKRAQLENNDGTAGLSFSQAIKTLNDGEGGSEGLDRLGLVNHYRKSTSSELASGKLGVVNYEGHSMAVIDGQVERWGNQGGRPKEGNAYVLL